MADPVDITKEIYFYDDRNKYDYFYKMKEVLYSDDKHCFCIAQAVGEEIDGIADEKILFHLQDGSVESEDLWSWMATDDSVWAKNKLADIIKRSK